MASGYSQRTASPASSPARPSIAGRRPPLRERSRQTSQNAAKLSSALSTCEKYSVENGSTSVPVPSVSATAVPVPAAIRSAPRATSASSTTAGASTPSSPSAHAIGASLTIVVRAAIARRRLKPYCSAGSLRDAHGAPPPDSPRMRATRATRSAPAASSARYSGSVANTSPGGLTE